MSKWDLHFQVVVHEHVVAVKSVHLLAPNFVVLDAQACTARSSRGVCGTYLHGHEHVRLARSAAKGDLLWDHTPSESVSPSRSKQRHR